MQHDHTASPQHIRHSPNDDPFFDDDRFKPTTDADSTASSPASDDDPSALTTFIMMPLHMTSFIISLHFVDNNYRTWRIWQHAPRRFPFWSWSTGEPYQEPQDATWNVADTPSVPARPSAWHLHGKVRKLARMEIGDALEMRGQVVAFGAIWLAIFSGCAFALLKHVYAWMT